MEDDITKGDARKELGDLMSEGYQFIDGVTVIGHRQPNGHRISFTQETAKRIMSGDIAHTPESYVEAAKGAHRMFELHAYLRESI